MEFGQYNIHVNGIGPGVFASGMSAQTSVLQADFHKHMVDRTVFKRPGAPEEIAGVTLFLASPASNYVTGRSST